MQEISCSIPIRVRNQNFYATLAINEEGEFVQFWNGSHAIPHWKDMDDPSQSEASGVLGPKLTPNLVIPTGAVWTDKVIKWYRSDKGSANGISDEELVAEFHITNGVGGISQTYSIPLKYQSMVKQTTDTLGSIRFIGDVASAENQDPDTFICDVVVTINGASYNLRRSRTMNISPRSNTSNILVISAVQGTALSSEKHSTQLVAKVYDGNTGDLISDLSNFIVEWSWEQEGTSHTATGSTLMVYRDKDSSDLTKKPWVDWEQLIICRLYKKEEGGTKGTFLALDTITITDQADLVMLDYSVSGDIDSTTPARVQFWLMKRDNTEVSAWSEYSPTDALGNPATWTAVIQDKSDNDLSTVWTGSFDSSGLCIYQGNSYIEITKNDMTGWGITVGDMKVTARLPE